MSLRTEFPFTLPRGFVDEDGSVHTTGVMRLATARDEIEPLRDPRVKDNDVFLGVIVLARVVTRLGHLSMVTPSTIENLFVADLAYLQDLYRSINFGDDDADTQAATTRTSQEVVLPGEALSSV